MKHAKHVLPGNFLAMILIACFKVKLKSALFPVKVVTFCCAELKSHGQLKSREMAQGS